MKLTPLSLLLVAEARQIEAKAALIEAEARTRRMTGMTPGEFIALLEAETRHIEAKTALIEAETRHKLLARGEHRI